MHHYTEDPQPRCKADRCGSELPKYDCLGHSYFFESHRTPDLLNSLTAKLTEAMPSGDGVMIRLFRLWRMVRKDLHLLWFALAHPRRPFWLVPALVLLALYALDPINFALPLVGAVDDVVLLPMLLHLLLRLLPAHIRSGYRDLPDRQALISRMTSAWSPDK